MKFKRRLGILLGTALLTATFSLLHAAPLTTERQILQGDAKYEVRQTGIPPSVEPDTGTQSEDLISDSLFLYAPSVLNFDVEYFLQNQAGPLASHTETVLGEQMSAADIIKYNAFHYGINPQMILVLLQMTTGVIENHDSIVPLGAMADSISTESSFNGYVSQLSSQLLTAYEAKRWDQSKGIVVLADGTTSSLPNFDTLNAGSYAIYHTLASRFTSDSWHDWIKEDRTDFHSQFSRWFGDPLERGNGIASTNAVLPSGHILPFSVNETWYYTGGPHTAARNRSAVDFAPPEIVGCTPNVLGPYQANRWVVASKGGTVVSSSAGEVVVDHGDGWRTYYVHIANQDRRSLGPINQGDRIGHPACIGNTNGIHVHFSIYNTATGFVPINGSLLTGWKINAGSADYEGTMTRNGVTRTRDGRRCDNPTKCGGLRNDVLNDAFSSTCCACTSGLGMVDAPPLGGELIGPPDPQAGLVVTFDLTAPGDLSTAPLTEGVTAADTRPPLLHAPLMETIWTNDVVQGPITWPAAVDEGSGVAGYNVYWGPDENGTAEALVTEAAYTPAPSDSTGGTAVYYLRVAPVDNAGNSGAWQTVNVQRYDTVAPAGTIEVSGGETVPTLPVTLNLAATDEHSGIAEMRFSSDGLNWSEWELYATQRGWQLADVDGLQTIYVQFRDVAENMSAPVSTAVTADLTLALPSSTNYRIARSVMGMGGGTKNSSTYRLQGTSGQPYQTGQMQSGSYRVAPGYWAQTVASSNQPPNAPSNPIPAQSATNIAITTALSWSATDPDNDPLTYKVRFGTTNPPPQVVSSQSTTTYDPPGNLANNTIYYWQIVVNDGRGGETSGPVWSFTTGDTADNTAPEVMWLSPAVAHNSYDAYGEIVTLKANATDDRGVTKARFDWWDNTAQQRVLIGEDTTAPYEVNLDTNSLRPGCHYVNAGAFDAAGNFREDYIFICLNSPPAPSLNAIANSDQDGTYTVSWSTVNGAAGYSLEEQFNSGSWQAVSGISGTSKGFTGKSAGTWCYRVAANNNAGAGAWSATQCTTVGNPSTSPNTFYISPANNKTIGGMKTTSADILRYQKSTDTWTLIYDGSVRGTAKNVSAFHVMDDGSLLLVFSANQKMTIEDNPKAIATPYDVVKFTPNNPNSFPLGPGTYTWFFQGKPNGLSVGAEKIDSLDYVGNRLLLSTTGTANVTLPNGTAFKPTKEDVFVFNRSTNQWESDPVIDGSNIPELKGKNISSVWDDPNSGDYYVTVTGAFKIGGVKGNGQSIVKLTPNGGSFTPSFVTWLAPGVKFPSNLDGLDIAP